MPAGDLVGVCSGAATSLDDSSVLDRGGQAIDRRRTCRDGQALAVTDPDDQVVAGSEVDSVNTRDRPLL